jgi:hypothetical protein
MEAKTALTEIRNLMVEGLREIKEGGKKVYAAMGKLVEVDPKAIDRREQLEEIYKKLWEKGVQMLAELSASWRRAGLPEAEEMLREALAEITEE